MQTTGLVQTIEILSVPIQYTAKFFPCRIPCHHSARTVSQLRVSETHVCGQRCVQRVCEPNLMCTRLASRMSFISIVDPNQPKLIPIIVHAHIDEIRTPIGVETSNSHGHVIVPCDASVLFQSSFTPLDTNLSSSRYKHLVLRVWCAFDGTSQYFHLSKKRFLCSHPVAKHSIIHVNARTLSMTHHMLVYRR